MKKQTIKNKEKASVSNKHRSKTNSSAGEKVNNVSAAEDDDEIDGSKPIGKAHGRLNDVHEGNREKYDKSLKETHE